MKATTWEAISDTHIRLKEIESEERHWNLTTEQSIHLVWELTTAYIQLLDIYNTNLAIIEKDWELEYIAWEELERYKLQDNKGIKIHLFNLQRELVDIIVNNNLIDDKLLLQQILFWNITRVEHIINVIR